MVVLDWMLPVPWRYVNSWHCNCCGLCCREYDIVLRFDEWLNLIRRYGVGVTRAGLSRFYIRRRSDGACVFLYNSFGKWYCGLQSMKPMACKLWPFKILEKPRYGKSREAGFTYNGKPFYVYVDPFCPGIRWGPPSQSLISHVIPEFIELALGIRNKQVYSTSSTGFIIHPLRGRERFI